MTIINEDITEATEPIIIHQVNCRDVMGSGVAKALFTKWPEVKLQYHEFNAPFVENSTQDRLLGLLNLVTVGDKTIINAYTQNYFGKDGKQYTDYVAVRKVFSYVSAELLNDDKIAIPYLYGCGLGGGDWGIVSGIIEEIFGDRAVLYKI